MQVSGCPGVILREYQANYVPCSNPPVFAEQKRACIYKKALCPQKLGRLGSSDRRTMPFDTGGDVALLRTRTPLLRTLCMLRTPGNLLSGLISKSSGDPS